MGFRFFPSFYPDRINRSEVEYYQTNGPYASITGVAGTKQLQALRFMFTHTYKRTNVALKLNRYVSPGFYLKQQAFNNNFFVSVNSYTKKERAGFYFYFLNNGSRNNENGGIIGDTIPDGDEKLVKSSFPVHINNAIRQNKEYTLMFNPWLKLNRPNDSLSKLSSYLQVKSRFNTGLYHYQDYSVKKEDFYPIMYLDTITNDSSRVMQIVNEASFDVLTKDKNFGASVGYKNEINRLWQHKDSVFLNHLAQAGLTFKKTIEKKDSLAEPKKYVLTDNVNAQYIVAGPMAGNYKVENKAGFTMRKLLFFFNLSAEKRSPDYIYNNWNSNNFYWQNNGYSASEMQQAELGVSFAKKAGLSVLSKNSYNYLYFDEIATPRQYNGSIQNLAVTAFVSHIFFKHLGVSLSNTFQHTSNTKYVRLPQNITTAKLFYAGNLYKNNLQLNIGVQGQVYQSFYGYSYMPATQMFYLQDRIATGNYPYVDLYVNARIRPVSVFVKIENALWGYAGSNYSFVPGYYQPDRAFRFGITWMFFD